MPWPLPPSRLWAGAGYRALDHDDWQAERTRRFNFGVGGVAAGILGQHNLDAVFAEQADVVLRGKRSARLDEDDVRQSEGAFGQIDQADDVGMLRGGLQFGERKAADAAEDIARRGANGLDGSGDIRCEVQRSPGCGCQAGRSTARSGVPVAAAASMALRLICAAKGCVASTSTSMRSPRR